MRFCRATPDAAREALYARLERVGGWRAPASEKLMEA
jgi:hypothetical protein